MCLDDVMLGSYVDKNVQQCPDGECRDFWADDDNLRCGWCGKVCGHRG